MGDKNLLNILEREYFKFSQNKGFKNPWKSDLVHMVNWFMVLEKLKLLLITHSFFKNDFKMMICTMKEGI